MKNHLNDYVLEIHKELMDIAMILSDTMTEIMTLDDKSEQNLKYLQGRLKEIIGRHSG